MVLIELWSPLIPANPFDGAFARDLQKARLYWRGEDRIWLLPDEKEVRRWEFPSNGLSYRECCVPAETFNYVSIVHIDEARRTYAVILKNADGVPEPLPSPLYQKWLQAEPTFVPGRTSVTMEIPRFTDNHVEYRSE